MKQKEKEKRFECSKELKEYIVCTILPFFIPFVIELPETFLSKAAAMTIVVIIGVIYCIWSLSIYLRGKSEIAALFNNKASRHAFSNAYILTEEKRNYLIEQTYKKPKYYIPDGMIPYDVHHYIASICKEFKNVISQVTEISNEYLSVSFIYRYCYDKASQKDKKWKWIVGRELTNIIDLNAFVNKKDTVFHYLLNHNVVFVFENDKGKLVDETHPENSSYYFSKRDNMHKNIGSIFSVRIMFSNNTKQYVDSILTVSSYGKKFSGKDNEDSLKNLVIEELLPYYQRCLETELGYLYLRHDRNC